MSKNLIGNSCMPLFNKYVDKLTYLQELLSLKEFLRSLINKKRREIDGGFKSDIELQSGVCLDLVMILNRLHDLKIIEKYINLNSHSIDAQALICSEDISKQLNSLTRKSLIDIGNVNNLTSRHVIIYANSLENFKVDKRGIYAKAVTWIYDSNHCKEGDFERDYHYIVNVFGVCPTIYPSSIECLTVLLEAKKRLNNLNIRQQIWPVLESKKQEEKYQNIINAYVFPCNGGIV